MKAKTAMAGALVALAALLIWLLLAPKSPPEERATAREAGKSAPTERSETPSGDRNRAAGWTERLPRAEKPAHERRLPKSLRGTDVDGSFFLDADGRFQPTIDAIELFEYFLTALGEEPLEDIIDRILATIHERLDGQAARDAIQFLERYLDYRERGGALGADFEPGADLLTRFERLRALRREIFGADVAERLFAEEEARVRVRLEQEQIRNDPSLSDDERAQRIDELFEQLPEEDRQARERATAALTLRREEAKMRQDGATEQQVQAMRTEKFGPEAAERLADLDRSRAEWNARVESFREARAEIENDRSLTAERKAELIDELLEEGFSEPERIRVGALDRIDAIGR